MSCEEHAALHATRRLLQAIADRDWDTYSLLTDRSLTAFEPEAVGHLVEGMAFHEFYFNLLKARSSYTAPSNTIVRPHVRALGPDAAVVSYVRLQQKIDSSSGRPLTLASEETRVWQRVEGQWRNVHFHRSSAPST